MGKYTKSYFENPYLDEDARQMTAELVMEEARQKWRTGGWRAQPEAFELKRDELSEETDDAKRPSSSRFYFDIKKDLLGGAISVASLRELDYSPSYRPKGSLDIEKEYEVGKRSTLQRYDVLAGEFEAPPEDLSFLSDAQARLQRDIAQQKPRQDGTLRFDARRLTSSVAERRSAVIRMLPDEEHGRADQIIEETKRRKLLADLELGKKHREEKNVVKRRITQQVITAEDPVEAAHARIKDSRLERLPEQEGMGVVTQELPEFASETRHWNKVESENPTWSEVARFTEVTIPKDEDDPRDVRARYISDELYSPRRRYMATGSEGSRPRLRADGSDSFENEYLTADGVDTHRVRKIMEKQYRGRWIPPEFFNDDELVNEWFNQYNRGALSGEDFVTWAYRQRVMAQQAQQAQHSFAPGRRYAPDSPTPPPRDLRPDPHEKQYEEARSRGYKQGERIRREEERETRRRTDGFREGYIGQHEDFSTGRQRRREQPQSYSPGGQFPPYMPGYAQGRPEPRAAQRGYDGYDGYDLDEGYPPREGRKPKKHGAKRKR